MKQFNLALKISLVLITISLASCKSITYYQVYKAEPDNNVSVTSNNKLEYEDENCRISYNLWSNGGNMGFKIFNKTDKNLIIDLGNSFFIRNGEAYDYYQNRVFTQSSVFGSTKSKSATTAAARSEQSLKSKQTSTSTTDVTIVAMPSIATGVATQSGLSTVSSSLSSIFGAVSNTNTSSTMSSTGQSVSFAEVGLVVIPPNTYKYFYEYNIVDGVFRDCDLLLFPKKKDIKTLSFSKSNSPYIFSNIISYSLENQDEVNIIENEFYVSEVTNYPEKEILESVDLNDCDIINRFSSNSQKDTRKYFKRNKVSPDGFYYRYIDFR